MFQAHPRPAIWYDLRDRDEDEDAAQLAGDSGGTECGSDDASTVERHSDQVLWRASRRDEESSSEPWYAFCLRHRTY